MMITDTNDLKKVAESSGKSEPEAVAQAFYEMMTIDLRMKVKAIRTPVLLLGSTALMLNPEMKKQAQKNYLSQVATIPRHKVVFAPKARHFIHLDEPEFFIREVESFLRTADKVNER
jgi:pimeloyl-ACP methyl ester carboxylesterase